MRSYQSVSLGVRVTPDVVRPLTGPQLVSLFKELTGEAIKKFRDRDTGVRRVLAALGPKLPDEIPVVDGQPRGLFNFPPKGEVRPFRQGTKRASLIEALSREGGATFDECRAATLWPYKILQENIRLLWSSLGFGLRQDAAGGKIFLVRV